MIEQTTEANYLNERCDFRDIFFTKRQLARPFPNAVRPSVRPSRSCIESKRVNNTFSNHLVNPPFWFFHTKRYTPPAFDVPVRRGGGPSEYCHAFLSWKKTGNGLATRWWKKFWRYYVYSFSHNSRTWQTDTYTHRQTPHDGIISSDVANRKDWWEFALVINSNFTSEFKHFQHI